eukprot:s1043_g14.t1
MPQLTRPLFSRQRHRLLSRVGRLVIDGHHCRLSGRLISRFTGESVDEVHVLLGPSTLNGAGQSAEQAVNWESKGTIVLQRQDNSSETQTCGETFALKLAKCSDTQECGDTDLCHCLALARALAPLHWKCSDLAGSSQDALRYLLRCVSKILKKCQVAHNSLAETSQETWETEVSWRFVVEQPFQLFKGSRWPGAVTDQSPAPILRSTISLEILDFGQKGPLVVQEHSRASTPVRVIPSALQVPHRSNWA